MIVPKNPHLDLAAIADSGQCFRWRRREDGYVIPALGSVLRVREMAEGTLELSCPEEEFERLWRGYFDLDTDYETMTAILPQEDEYLRAAADYGRGIRILRQDPWETLISFLISQRKNIPAIRQAVKKLCQAAGRVIGEDEIGPVYAFPSPAELARLGEEGLRACALGYRAPYVMRAAEVFSDTDLDGFCGLEDEALLKALCNLYGVGPKIAQCVMLFGFHRLNAFPVDVWIRRVEEMRYPGGLRPERFAPFAGVMQQYMYAYERYLELNKEQKNRPDCSDRFSCGFSQSS